MELKEIQEKLLENVCKVVFTKVDGTERTMNCTLKVDLLPEQKEFHSKSEQRRVEATLPPTSVRVFDLDKKDWRAFRIDSVKSFEIV